MRVLAIDPGTKKHGVVELHSSTPAVPPMVVMAYPDLSTTDAVALIRSRRADVVVIEWIISFGGGTLDEVLVTGRMAGRFEQAAVDAGSAVDVSLTRRDASLILVGRSSSSVAEYHEAIRHIYRYAGLDCGGGKDACKGVKAAPGPLFRITKHAWEALAVGVAWLRREGA